MSNKNMKLILESWRQFSSKIENNEHGTVYLFENKKPVETNFDVLLEKFDNGEMSKDELFEQWNSSMQYEHNLLTEEIGIDWEKEAGMLDDPDYRPPQDRGGAMSKIRDFILEKSVQIYQMAQRGVEQAVDAAAGLINKGRALAREYPVATKIVGVVALSLAMFALMSALDSDTAQAAIKAPGLPGGIKPGAEGQISDATYEALRGLIHQSKDLEGTGLEFRTRAMKLVDAAQAAGEVVDFSTLKTEYGKFANEQLKTLDGLFKLARPTSQGGEGDPEAFKWLQELVEVGKNAVYRDSGGPTRPIPE